MKIWVMDAQEAKAFTDRYGATALGGYRDRMIAVHPQVLTAEYARQYREDVRSGFASLGSDDPVVAFLGHEYGHHVATLVGDDQRVWSAIHVTQAGDRVSRYGSKNGELIPEIWCEYATGDNPRPWIIELGSVIETVTGEDRDSTMDLIKPGLMAVTQGDWKLRRTETVPADDPEDPNYTGSGGDDDADDDDHSDDDDADDDEDDDEDETRRRRKPAKKATKGKSSDEDDDEETYTAEEYDRVRTRMRNADRTAHQYKEENERLKARLAKLEKPGKIDKKDDDDTPTVDHDAAEREAKREKALRETRIENAFLRAAGSVKDRIGNVIQWEDPEDALAVADKLGLLDDVLDEDGTVDRREMARALRTLAKRKPYLVVKPSKASGTDEDDDGDEDEEPAARPTTRKVNGRRKGKGTGETDRAALAQKFPALNRR